MQKLPSNPCAKAYSFTQNSVRLRILPPDLYDERQMSLEFCVWDTGDGIAPDRVGAVFNAFEQENVSTTREHGGTGLGLTIASWLTRVMGGHMWLTSELGAGSKFFFTMKTRSVGAPRTHQRPRRPLLACCVEIISDSICLKDHLQSALSNTAARVRLRACSTGDPPAQECSVCVVDYQSLPNPSKFFSQASSADCPFVVLVYDEQLNQASRFANAENFSPVFHAKPISHHEFVDAVQTALLNYPLSSGPRARPTSSAAASSSESASSPLIEIDKSSSSSSSCSFSSIQEQKEDPLLAEVRVLFVDDNAINRKVGQAMMNCLGLTFQLADCGQQAVELHKAGKCDVILMDRYRLWCLCSLCSNAYHSHYT
jgi:hypothetical protein